MERLAAAAPRNRNKEVQSGRLVSCRRGGGPAAGSRPLGRAEELRASGKMPQEVFDRIRQAALTAAPELAAEGAEQDPRPALIRLAEAGDADGVRQELAGPLVDPDVADASGTTALLVAVRQGHEDVARLLIRRGADVNKAGPWRFTPLMYAAIWGHAGLAGHLLQSGADPRARDVRGDTALDHAVGERQPEIADAIRAALGAAPGRRSRGSRRSAGRPTAPLRLRSRSKKGSSAGPSCETDSSLRARRREA
ncbi:unnamed protein product, partial [Prorocentrum cordatum]